MAKNYCPVSLLSVVNKVFEKLIKNTLVDHLEKCGFFSDLQYGFRSSQSTAILVTVVSDRLARELNSFGATPTVALDTSNAFEFSVQVFLTILSLMKFLVSYWSLICLFSLTDDFEWI